MKDLQVDSNGDLVLSNGDFAYISDGNLLAQKTRLILGTNKGEWEYNLDEGIDFHVILTKNPNYDMIVDTVQDGLHQVEEGLQITDYSFSLDAERHLTMKFTAELSDGLVISYTFGESPIAPDTDDWIIRALADIVEVYF